MIVALVLALITSVTPSSAPSSLAGSPSGSVTAERDVVAALESWRESFEGTGRPLDPTRFETLDRLLIDLRGYARASAGHRRQSAQVLLDLYGAGLAASRSLQSLRAADGWRLAERAEVEFDSILNDELARWVAREVLVVESGNSAERRAAAALLLADTRTPEVRLALSVNARGGGILAQAAFEALEGWPDESVHQLFLQTLWRADIETPAAILGAAEAHFRASRLEPTSRTVAPLESYVRERIDDESWRRASRAISVSAALPDSAAVPLLIASLETWLEPSQDGRRVRRVQHDLARELRTRSGLDLGLHADRWRTWWDASRSGAADPRARAGAAESETTFFGLRPETDRVTFVLDRSGSMDQAFAKSDDDGTTNWTRYRESIDQMVHFLEGVGSDARFNVVLFHDGVEAWRKRLQPADTTHLRAARAWALRRRPGGGTQLRHGVERAFEVRPNGELDLETLEADTIVVLCDGKTSDGSNWVLPFLRRVNPRARIVVHGVQVGRAGDGTLELLAAATGGDFVRIE